MSGSDDIRDRLIEYRTWLIRYENRVVRDVLATMVRGEEQALGAIIAAHEDYLAAGGRPGEWTGRGVAMRRRALRRVREAYADVFPEARQSLRVALGDLAEDVQAEFVAALEESLPSPVVDEMELSRVPERQIANILDDKFGERLEGSAAKAADVLKQLEDSAVARVDRVIVDGLRDGTGTRNLIGRVRREIGAKRGSKLSRDIATHVRTAVQTTANDVAAQAYQENDDIIRAEQYVATLDDDTCPICGPLDGMTRPLGDKSFPRPPRHPNCRCFVSPVLKSWDQLGMPDTKANRRAFPGRAPQRTKWADWVQRNPQRLRDVLGPSRADLVESGQVRLRDLTNTREVLTLERLREKRKAVAA